MRHPLALGVRGARRLSGFAFNQILLGAASLVLMPAVIGAAGLEIWSSIVLAQALAAIAATVVGCGYGVNGPAIVATLTAEEGVSYFRVAEGVRSLVAVPSVAFMIGAMFVIPNPDPVAGLLGGIHLVINAFSATFFYIGRAAPRWQLLAEICPRVALMLAGAISLAFGVPLLIGLALPPLGALLAVAISNSTIRWSLRTTPQHPQAQVTRVRGELRKQLGPAASSVLRGCRDALPVLVVTAVAAELVGAFGVFDRIVRQALGVMSSVTSTLQGWVPRRMATEGGARPAVAAMLVTLAMALAVLLLFTWFGAPVIRWLAAGMLTPTFAEIVLCATVIATSIVIQVVAYACLVPLGVIRGVIWSALVGIVGILVATPIMLSAQQSVAYALAAVVIANVVQLVVQLWLFGRARARVVNRISRNGA